MDDRLTSRHEQDLRDLNPAEHPDIAALLSRIDCQRSVIRGKQFKIERQSRRLHVLGEEVVKRNQRIKEQSDEIERLREQIARLEHLKSCG